MKDTNETETRKCYAESYRLMIDGPDGNGFLLEGEAVITERPLEVCHFGDYSGKPTDPFRDKPEKSEASFRKSLLLVDGHSGRVAEMECYLQAAQKELLPDAIVTAKGSDIAVTATSHGKVLKGLFTLKTRDCTAADVAKVEAARKAANGEGELLAIARDTNVTAHGLAKQKAKGEARRRAGQLRAMAGSEDGEESKMARAVQEYESRRIAAHHKAAESGLPLESPRKIAQEVIAQFKLRNRDGKPIKPESLQRAARKIR